MPNISLIRRLRTVVTILIEDARGATAIEYALIAMLIALAIVGTLPIIGTTVSTTFTTISGKL